MCFARTSLCEHITDTHHAHVITGFGRVIANKAGVAISFDLFSTSFLFVTAHFAAGSKPAAVTSRNADFARIDSALVQLMCPAVAMTRVPIADRDLRSQKSGSTTSEKAKAVWSASALFERVFWCGDFNYRVEAEFDEAKQRVQEGRLEELLACDQLIAQRAEGNVFTGFAEGAITFNPTYKFDKWSDLYDTSAKRRVPSWTDRVLSRTPPGDHDCITVTRYTSVDDIKCSDHRPVVAQFQVRVKKEPRIQGESRGASKQGSTACVIS